jgi:hypothetical protein
MQEQVVQTIRDWVKIDNELLQLKREIATRKQQKKVLSDQLDSIMEKKDIDSFAINDGKIERKNKKTKKAISKKMLLNILSQYYQDDAEKASEVNNFILENREETVTTVITRKVNKSDQP